MSLFSSYKSYKTKITIAWLLKSLWRINERWLKVSINSNITTKQENILIYKRCRSTDSVDRYGDYKDVENTNMNAVHFLFICKYSRKDYYKYIEIKHDIYHSISNLCSVPRPAGKVSKANDINECKVHGLWQPTFHPSSHQGDSSSAMTRIIWCYGRAYYAAIGIKHIFPSAESICQSL